MSAAQARQTERSLLGLFFALLVWVPLPLASNRPWAVAVLAAVMWALLVPTVALRMWSPAGVPGPGWRAGRGPLLLLGAVVVWLVLQLVGAVGASADRHETRLYLLRSLAYLAAFALTLLLVDSDRRRLQLFHVLLAAGVLQALLAIGLLSGGVRYDFAGTPVHHVGRALGTFANADHLAHYMALTLSAGVGIMLAGMGSRQSGHERGWRGQLRGALAFFLSAKMLVRLMLVLLVIVLVLSRSRMGNGSFFLSLFVLSGWMMAASKRLRRPAGLLMISLLVVDLVVIGQWVGLEKVVQRLEATDISRAEAAPVPESAASAALVGERRYREESLEERLRVAVDALQLVRLKPWTGWGGGSFFTVFPQVKRESIGVRFDHAHNDYAEIAVDLGLPGLALLGVFFGSTFWRVSRLMTDSQPSTRRGLAAGIAMAMLCALLHALVDFNLQVPANALTLTVLCAVAWTIPVAVPHVSRTPRGSGTPHGSLAQ